MEHLIAKNEEEYVQLALQLASDVTELSNLRMSLRELMSKSPVCDGPKYALGLESTYRNMWRRYCEGDVPSLRHEEMLQSQAISEESATVFSTESPRGSIKANGFNLAPPSMRNLSPSEENGGSTNLNKLIG